MEQVGSVNLTNFKLEQGNKSTDWTPAPEDLDNKITTNITAISVQQGKIDSLVSTTTQISGQVSTLETNYSNISQTVDAISSTVSSQATTISNLQTNVSNNTSAIQQTQNSITQKVWSSDITNAIDNVSIGGKNYIRNSNFISTNYWYLNSSVSTNGQIITEPYGQFGNCLDYIKKSAEGYCILTSNSTNMKFKKNKEYTLSFFAKTNSTRNMIAKICTTQGTVLVMQKNFNIYTEWNKYVYTFSSLEDTDMNTVKLQFDYEKTGVVYFERIKLEEGNKATDWTPAPEDLTNYTDTKISAKSAEIKTTTDNISSRVTATETTLNANGTGLVSRMSSVEQEITASAITTKISTAINNGTSSINTTYFTQDNTGLTIKNGGIKVLNSLNTQIFGVDTDGQLSIRGKLEQYNSNGRKSIEIKNNALKIYDYKSTTDDLAGGIENLNDLNNTNSGVAVFGKINHRLSLGMLRDDNTIYEHITCVDTGTYRRTEIGADIYNKYSTRYCNSSLVSSGQIGINFNGDKGLCIAANSLEGLHLGLGFDSSFASYLDIVKDANGNGKVIIYGDLQVMGQINQ